MKRILGGLIWLGCLLITIGIAYNYRSSFVNFINNYLKDEIITKDITISRQNQYYRDYSYKYVQITDNTSPSNYQELLNLIYSAANNGYSKFEFYCEYETCFDDLKTILKDQNTVSTINNYLHPYNTFTKLETSYGSDSKIILIFYKKYTDEDISVINNKINLLSSELIKSNDTDYNNILRIHDYIVNNTKYDSTFLYNDTNSKAIGPLVDGYALCGGYTDTMSLFLERLGLNNFQVASEKHVWNAVEINGVWYNIDLTWDDPVNSLNLDLLEHNYFLISTSKLQNLDMTEHDFVLDNYQELKNI